ncbi:MAG: thiol:disulfide interchange protein DsbA/DsbL [Kangiellaceae bacterium]
MKLFKASFICLLTLIVITLAGKEVNGATRELVKGEDYEQVSPKGTKKPEVLEFFNYACPACYRLEGLVEKFKKNNPDVKITPVPVELRPAWEIYVRAYYLGKLLKVLDKSHPAVFHRLHVEKKPITSDSELKAFFVSLGVEPEKYDKANKSFALNASTRKAKQQARKFRISGTPVFVANRQYKLNNQALGTAEMIEHALDKLTKANL